MVSTSDESSSPRPTPDGDTPPEAALAVFVYGTLKEGVENHAHFCRGASSVQAAWTWGRLYLWQPTIPILGVPEGQVLLRGTEDPGADLQRAEAWVDAPAERLALELLSPRDWRRIRGQLIEFPDAGRRLDILDAYEGFRPRTPGHYERVLVPVTVAATDWHAEQVRAAWVYVLPADAEVPDELLPTDGWGTDAL